MTTGRHGCRRATAAPAANAQARTGPKPGKRSEPRFVQLLTPEGERVEHPDYSVDFTDEEYRGLYRDLVIVRKLDAEATALQRQGELGIWASLLGPGGGAGRLRPGAAPAGHGLPDLPRARRPLLPRHRPDHAAGPVPRRRPGRLGPERVQVQHVHDRDRRPDAARHRLRHGHRHGRQDRQRRRRGGHRLLRRRRHQPGRRERGVRLGQRLQRADRVLLPEQPVRDLRAAGAADPRPALPAGRRLRLPRRPGRRQRRARLLRGDPRGARRRPARPGPDADRGVHLPDGRAHHLRRPDPLPHRQRGRGLAGQGPDRPAAGVPRASSSSPTTTSSPRSTRQARRGGRTCASGCSPCPTRSR